MMPVQRSLLPRDSKAIVHRRVVCRTARAATLSARGNFASAWKAAAAAGVSRLVVVIDDSDAGEPDLDSEDETRIIEDVKLVSPRGLATHTW